MASQLNRPISLSNILLIVATGFLVVLLWQLRSLLVTLDSVPIQPASIPVTETKPASDSQLFKLPKFKR